MSDLREKHRQVMAELWATIARRNAVVAMALQESRIARRQFNAWGRLEPESHLTPRFPQRWPATTAERLGWLSGDVARLRADLVHCKVFGPANVTRAAGQSFMIQVFVHLENQQRLIDDFATACHDDARLLASGTSLVDVSVSRFAVDLSTPDLIVPCATAIRAWRRRPVVLPFEIRAPSSYTSASRPGSVRMRYSGKCLELPFVL